jgi:hypothetical protein
LNELTFSKEYDMGYHPAQPSPLVGIYRENQKKYPQSATVKDRKGEILEAKMFEIVKECSKFEGVDDKITVLQNKLCMHLL